MSLLQGGTGGAACRSANKKFNWEINGGFGGGGGGCRAGGGGGGYTGGNVSVTDSEEHNGQGGSSYISDLGRDSHFEPGAYWYFTQGRPGVISVKQPHYIKICSVQDHSLTDMGHKISAQ